MAYDFPKCIHKNNSDEINEQMQQLIADQKRLESIMTLILKALERSN